MVEIRGWMKRQEAEMQLEKIVQHRKAKIQHPHTLFGFEGILKEKL